MNCYVSRQYTCVFISFMMWIIGLLAHYSFQTKDSKGFPIQTTNNKEKLNSLSKLSLGSRAAMLSKPKTSNL